MVTWESKFKKKKQLCSGLNGGHKIDMSMSQTLEAVILPYLEKGLCKCN